MRSEVSIEPELHPEGLNGLNGAQRLNGLNVLPIQ
jgi:hypothetical protein